MALRLPFGAVHGRIALFDGVSRGEREGSLPGRVHGLKALPVGMQRGTE